MTTQEEETQVMLQEHEQHTFENAKSMNEKLFYAMSTHNY